LTDDVAEVGDKAERQADEAEHKCCRGHPERPDAAERRGNEDADAACDRGWSSHEYDVFRRDAMTSLIRGNTTTMIFDMTTVTGESVAR
jgi:hypothetical protein